MSPIVNDVSTVKTTMEILKFCNKIFKFSFRNMFSESDMFTFCFNKKRNENKTVCRTRAWNLKLYRQVYIYTYDKNTALRVATKLYNSAQRWALFVFTFTQNVGAYFSSLKCSSVVLAKTDRSMFLRSQQRQTSNKQKAAFPYSWFNGAKYAAFCKSEKYFAIKCSNLDFFYTIF